jgi:hypothetical protein
MPHTQVGPLPQPIRNSPAAKNGVYRTLVQLVENSFGDNNHHMPSVLRSEPTPEEKAKGILAFTPQQVQIFFSNFNLKKKKVVRTIT